MLTPTIILLLFTQKLIDLNDVDVDAPWFYMVAETRVAAENHWPWMGDHKEKKEKIRTCHIVIMGIKYRLQRGKVRILQPDYMYNWWFTCLYMYMTQDFKIYWNAGRSESIIGPQAWV